MRLRKLVITGVAMAALVMAVTIAAAAQAAPLVQPCTATGPAPSPGNGA